MNQGIIRVAFRGNLGLFALDAAFSVPAAGVTALFGPSGCGKTTVLRCMAGLCRLPNATCVIDGDVWQDGAAFRPPHRRPVGYVFQEASLFPHLSVRRNLLFGATRRSAAAPHGIPYDEVLDLLGLTALLDRSPRHLSGGERQRVAIGRALLSQPRLLLMDEPLSALDRQTRAEILPFLQRLRGRLTLPIVYVTHETAEVEQLADTLVLMEGGRVRAVGPLSRLQSDPALPLASERGAAVSLDAVVESYDDAYGLVTLRCDATRFVVPGRPGTSGDIRRLRIAADDVSLARELSRGSTILNVVPVRIVSASQVGNYEMLAVLALGGDAAGPRLLARVTRRSWEQLGLDAGVGVFAQIKSVALAPATEV